MAGELILVNPRRHKRRRMTAKQRQYFGKRRRRTTARRNPVAAALPGFPVARRRRRRRGVRTFARAARRRYSASTLPGFINGTLLPAAVGAAGAVGVDLAWQYLPLPAALKEGPAAYATRIGLSIALGYAAGMIGGRQFGEQVAGGALVVTMADLAKGYLQTVVPAPVPTPAPAPAADQGSGTGAYVGAYVGDYDNDDESLAYYNAGQASYA